MKKTIITTKKFGKIEIEYEITEDNSFPCPCFIALEYDDNPEIKKAFDEDWNEIPKKLFQHIEDNIFDFINGKRDYTTFI